MSTRFVALWRCAHILSLVACQLSPKAAAASDPSRLSLPVACEPGVTCFVQHYVDTDPGPLARDYTCGRATYDGHNGIDFRLLSAAAAKRGVEVVAAADGTILRLRDGVADAFPREVGRGGTTDRECGNGVVVAHAGGLETQYCHLLRGSLRVSEGQRVLRGEPLGQVGYSGLADFAHLHFTVRRDGRIVDPFTGRDFKLPDRSTTGAPAAIPCDAETTGRLPPATLWDITQTHALAYHSTEMIQTGFAQAIPNWASLEHDHESFAKPEKSSAGLFVFTRLINLGALDQVRFRITGPSGFDVDQTTAPPGRAKAIFVAGAGRRASTGDWLVGRYDAKVEVLRNGRAIAASSTTLDLK